jgi:L-amino acid N-acyltransferase YncA
LGAVLLAELIDIARLLGLTQLAVELFEDQHALIRMFQRYGFRIEGHMPVYQTVILVREIAPAQRATA